MSKSRPFFPNLKGVSPINITVELIEEEGIKGGFDRSEYEKAIESRLCNYGIRVGEVSIPNQYPFLYLQVWPNMSGIATKGNQPFRLYSVVLHLSFNQIVLVPEQGATILASTWSETMVGNVEEDSVGRVRESVIGLVDIFANDYFRANSR